MKFTLFENPADQSTRIDFEVTQPQLCDDGAFCQVRVSNLPEFAPIIGLDPFSALENALIFMRAMAANRSPALYWENGQPLHDLVDDAQDEMNG